MLGRLNLFCLFKQYKFIYLYINIKTNNLSFIYIQGQTEDLSRSFKLTNVFPH